jgi:ABC-2 type transport system permease protein
VPHEPAVMPPQPRRFGAVNWLGVWTLYSKEVERFLKVAMQSVVAPVVTTLLFLTVFSLAFGDRVAMTGGVPLPNFLAPGLIMMAVIQNSFANTASSVLISKIQGNIVDVLMPPIAPGEMAVCYVLAGLTRGAVCALAVGLAMLPFVDLTPQHVWPLLFFVAAAGFLLAQLGFITGMWADKFDHLSAVTNFVITPLAFLSGTFYSVERLPETFRAVSHANPFFYMIDGFRYAFIGHADGSLTAGVVLLLALNAVMWLVLIALLRRGWNLKA